MSTNICKNDDCLNGVRKRSFKGSQKEYYDSHCNSCQATLKRYGLTAPEVAHYKKNKWALPKLTSERSIDMGFDQNGE